MGMMGEQFVRSVGGRVVSSFVTNAPSMRIEKISREANGPWHWHFRQPELCLFWFTGGQQRLRATIDGRPATFDISGTCRLCIFPSRTEIEGEWSAGPKSEYSVVFLNSDFVEQRLRTEISRPIVGFAHQALMSSLAELLREATTPDNVFNLLAEGWSIQALAYMARVTRNEKPRPHKSQGGLSGRSERLLNDYILAHLADELTLADLARLVGLSKRHLQRAFSENFGTTPHRYILQQRVDRAKHHLIRTKDSITDIALATGFGEVEHFSTTFKRFTGLTPSEFRRVPT